MRSADDSRRYRSSPHKSYCATPERYHLNIYGDPSATPVWRDFNGNFGRDLLREHYDNAKGTAHKH